MQSHIHPVSLPDASMSSRLASFHYGFAVIGKKVYIQAALHAE